MAFHVLELPLIFVELTSFPADFFQVQCRQWTDEPNTDHGSDLSYYVSHRGEGFPLFDRNYLKKSP